MTKGERARYALGVIRLVNGSLALVGPKRIVKMFGIDPDQNGAAVYALRLFGIRTVVLGLNLLRDEGEALESTLRDAPLIHASDTAAAVLAGLTSALPRRAALTGAIFSSINTGLALVAREES